MEIGYKYRVLFTGITLVGRSTVVIETCSIMATCCVHFPAEGTRLCEIVDGFEAWVP